MKGSIFALVAALGAAALIAGCTPQAREQYGQAGQNASQAAKDAGQGVATDARAAGQAAADAADETKDAAANSMMTGQVRVALTNAHNLHVTDLNVDTLDKKIILKGVAATQEDKEQAEQLAQATAGGDYTIENQLMVK